jgi:thymidylate synthase (FAD)
LRHRSFSFQEFSQRYALVTEDPIYRAARLQDTKNRQNSVEVDDPELQRLWEYQQREVAKASERAYKWAVKAGIAKEVARAVLPEGLIPTRLYMNGTVRSWIHYVQLRSSNGTQKEHAEIALECGRLLRELGIEFD